MISKYLIESYRTTFRHICQGRGVKRQHPNGKWYGHYGKSRIREYLERFSEEEQRQITAGMRRPKVMEDNSLLKEVNRTLRDMTPDERQLIRALLRPHND